MNSSERVYDVIVVGAGHAGVEAALASARTGSYTLLITGNLDTVAQMSCNPAIGGIAKGHIVREIDALGGEMGINTDNTGIQFRMLNLKKGPSVRAPRAQCDKKAYQFRMKWVVERQNRLDLKQGLVDKLIISGDYVIGVQTTTGTSYRGKTVLLTTGTFLCGVIHIGKSTTAGGRSGDPSASLLSENLNSLGFQIGRMKTGTPPRISRRSINFSLIDEQRGENPIPFFSFITPSMFHVEQLPCYVTHTTHKTKEVVVANLSNSALYSGQIHGTGPRYCPSIEDKIVKFHSKDVHQVFIEPEGRSTEEFYVNGISTSMPEGVQHEIVRSIRGLENAEIMRPAYAVEYDYCLPHQLLHTLETKLIRNLYFAGQINGTSGYEEAAGQGIVAGINASLRAQSKPEVVFERSDSYIGVMIDDLTTRSTDEPYRMFTSRAEFRLLLRQDNADLRLTPIGRDIGLVDNIRWQVFLAKKSMIESELQRLINTRVENSLAVDILKRNDVSYATLPCANHSLPDDVKEEVEIQIKYQGYIARDLEQIKKVGTLERKQIPRDFNYGKIAALRIESRQKLSRFKPETIGQASRIQGVTPADIAVLLVWLKKYAAMS